MKLVLLGSGGYHPSESRHTASLMLPEIGVVLDAGTGLFRVTEYLQTDELDVFLSHAHLDHVVGLTYLLGLLHDRSMRRVCVYGQPKVLSALEHHLFAEELFPVPPKFEWRTLEPQTALRGGGSLSWFPLEHPGGATGYRLDFPATSMAYVTDTTAAGDAPYVEQIRGVGLLVHECYFADERADLAQLTGHSWLSNVLEVARRANVGRLVLVHLDPLADARGAPLDLAAARRVFPAVELGVDRMVLEF